MADARCVLSIVPRRWLRCAIFHIAVSSTLWLLWGSHISRICFWFCDSRVVLPLLYRFARFLLFLSSQIVFILGEAIVTHPEDKDAATVGDVAIGALKLAWRATVGAPLNAVTAQEATVLARKLHTSRSRILFAFLCSVSGSLSIVSLKWRSQPFLYIVEEACRGASLGLVYAFVHVYTRRMVLVFPVIQRCVFFRFKLGLPEAASTGLKISIVSLPFAEFAVFILNSSGLAATAVKIAQRSVFAQNITFFGCSLFVAVCWEIGHNLVQILHTQRHTFAPPLGSSAAERSPNELLLKAFEGKEKSSLVYYLAILDLCMLSESNTDTWRKSALFEETGETYQKVISECLKPLDSLTWRLAKGLDGSSSSHQKDVLKQQMQLPGEESLMFRRECSNQIFQDFQLCSWCARIVGALTAISKNNDRYGVAQLRGCNGAVVSSLLSCLLVVEVYLGRRSSTQSGQLISANSIKWTIPSRGHVSDTGKRQHFPFRKKSLLHKKAYAMADVLRTSLYQIITVFRGEMILGGSGSSGFVIAERDWLGKGKPLYGNHEMHMQSLSLFLDFRM